MRLRRGGYLAVLHASNVLVALGQALQTLLRTRGGPDDAIAILLRVRRPLDDLELLRQYQAALTLVLDAQDALASVGSQRAVQAGEAVCIAAANYLQACLSMTRPQRLWHYVTGGTPTKRQQRSSEAALKELFESRGRLIHVLRSEMGEAPVVLGVDPTQPE